jgi:hypothetical protein
VPKGIYPRPTLAQTLNTNSSTAEDSGCIEWLGPFSPSGYGHVGKRQGDRKITFRTHRLAYELAYGPIPEGLVVRHKCDNPPCINPAHLELGTSAQNNRDRDTRGRNHYSNLNHCPQGHPYDHENTCIKQDGSRMCRACNRARSARYRQLAKQAKLSPTRKETPA